MIEFELTIEVFVITAGIFKYTSPIRIPLVKVLVKAIPLWCVEFAVEVEELLEVEWVEFGSFSCVYSSNFLANSSGSAAGKKTRTVHVYSIFNQKNENKCKNKF